MTSELNPRLVGIGGPLKGTAFSLSPGEVSIGRDSSNQLWAPDPALSRRHCLVVATGEQVSIRDLGSRNGTLVNGVPVASQPDTALRTGAAGVFVGGDGNEVALERVTVSSTLPPRS